MYLLALERGRPFEAVFADTGHEHPATLQYVADLPAKTGGPPIRTVRADFAEANFERKRQTIRETWPREGVPPDIVERALGVCRRTGVPFLDACILQSGFPSHYNRFCTEKLKVRPIKKFAYRPHLDAGRNVVSWQAVRREESKRRAGQAPWQKLTFGRPPRVYAYRPLLDWRVADVWRMHKRHGVIPNPLYGDGQPRVGCMPCIFADKEQIRLAAKHYPEHVERVREWESIVGPATKNRIPVATLFPGPKVGRQGGADIDSVVAWSRNGAPDGGPENGGLHDSFLECSGWNACE